MVDKHVWLRWWTWWRLNLSLVLIVMFILGALYDKWLRVVSCNTMWLWLFKKNLNKPKGPYRLLCQRFPVPCGMLNDRKYPLCHAADVTLLVVWRVRDGAGVCTTLTQLISVINRKLNCLFLGAVRSWRSVIITSCQPYLH